MWLISAKLFIFKTAAVLINSTSSSKYISNWGIWILERFSINNNCRQPISFLSHSISLISSKRHFDFTFRVWFHFQISTKIRRQRSISLGSLSKLPLRFYLVSLEIAASVLFGRFHFRNTPPRNRFHFILWIEKIKKFHFLISLLNFISWTTPPSPPTTSTDNV
jgi:hypothetical protein